MAVYEFFWKIWLRLNLLTKDVDNDYTAEVSTMKNTFRNEDIARAIVAKGVFHGGNFGCIVVIHIFGKKIEP